MTERIAAPKADELSWLKESANDYFYPVVNFLVVLPHSVKKKKKKKREKNKESQEKVLSGNHVSLKLHDIILTCSEQ